MACRKMNEDVAYARNTESGYNLAKYCFEVSFNLWVMLCTRVTHGKNDL